MNLIAHTVPGLVTLCAVMSLAKDDYATMKIWTERKTVTVKFNQSMFTQFYECMCVGNISNCEVTYNYNYKVGTIKRDGSQNKNNLNMNFYTCQHSRTRTFTCKQDSQTSSCNETKNYKALRVTSSSCDVNKCVAIFTGAHLVTEIDYNDLSNVVSDCADSCEVLTVTSTTSTHRTTTKVMTTTTTKLTTTSVKPATTYRLTTTTVQTTAISSTTGNIEPTTDANVTISQKPSDSKRDKLGIILGVAIPLIVVVASGVVVFMAVLWRKRKRLQHNRPSLEHQYANISKSVTALHGGNLETAASSDLKVSSSDYVNCVFDNTIEECSSSDTKERKISKIAAAGDRSKLQPEFVYSTAKAVDETRATNRNVAVNDAGYSYLGNTLDETTDGATFVYSIPSTNCRPTSNSQNDLSGEFALATKPPQDRTSNNHVSGSVAKDETKDIREHKNDIREHKNDIREHKNDIKNKLSDYQNIEKNMKSRFKITTQKAQDVRDPHKRKDLTNIPDTSDDNFPTNTELRHSANENVYSFAGLPTCSQNSETINCELPHVYAKLREKKDEIHNPYDTLFQPSQDGMSAQPVQGENSRSTQNVAQSCHPESLASVSVYSTASSVLSDNDLPNDAATYSTATSILA